MNLADANAVLSRFGKRIREVPVEEVAEATKESTLNGRDEFVITPVAEDYLPVVLTVIDLTFQDLYDSMETTSGLLIDANAKLTELDERLKSAEKAAE